MIDFLKVYPRLKQVFGDDMVLETAEHGTIKLAPEDSPVMRDFVEGLKIAYAIDEDSYFRFVLQRDMTELINNFFDNPDANGLLVRNIYRRENNNWEFVQAV